MQELAVTRSASNADTNQITKSITITRPREARRRVTGCPSSSCIRLLFFFLLIHSFMYACRGAICLELFRTDSITPSGKIKCLKSRWKVVPPIDGLSLAMCPGCWRARIVWSTASKLEGKEAIPATQRSVAKCRKVARRTGRFPQLAHPRGRLNRPLTSLDEVMSKPVRHSAQASSAAPRRRGESWRCP